MCELNFKNPTSCIHACQSKEGQFYHILAAVSPHPQGSILTAILRDVLALPAKAGGEDGEDDLGCHAEKEAPSEARDNLDISMKRTYMTGSL